MSTADIMASVFWLAVLAVLAVQLAAVVREWIRRHLR